MLLPVSFALCASGAAGLVFQILWFHQASLVFGSSAVAATVILSSFMGGLAIGNAVAAQIDTGGRPLLARYAVLELTVAVTGVALTFGLPRLAAHDFPLAIPFLLLLVPASAMGATLPIAVAAVATEDDGTFGSTLGTLYGWNTLGAVGGVLLAETTLIASAGILGSAWIAAGLDTAAAAVAFAVAGRLPRPSIAAPRRFVDSDAFERLPLRLMACAALAGFAFLALELIWFRFLSMFILTTTLAMSAMLAVVLTGIAVGSLVAAPWVRRRDRSRFLPAVAAAAGVCIAQSYSRFGMLTSGTQIASITWVLWLALVMTCPTSLASGILFTLLGDAIRRRWRGDLGAAAAVTCANTVGAMCGPPAAAFLLIPRLGTEHALWVLAAGYLAIGALAWTVRVPPLRQSAGLVTLVAVAAATVMLIRFPFGLMTMYFGRVAQAYAEDGSQIVATREGPTESILLLQQRWMGSAVYSRLVTNGFSMSGTAIPGQRYMRYFVDWPVLMHAAPLRRVLVIGYGVGVTLGEALEATPADRIDLAEISRDIVDVGDTIYAPGQNPARDVRVRLHLDDGRHFLETTSERFDLITGEPPPPRTPGAVSIYTREHFRLIRDHLAEGGMVTYWVPVARPNPGTDVDTIIRAFCIAFDDCTLWNATPFDLMLVGTRNASAGPTLEAFRRPWSTPLGDRLRDVGFEAPEQIGATFLGDAEYLNALTARTPPLIDDFPQRLRPTLQRSSLSDPRYPVDRDVVAEYHGVIDPSRARDAFERSAAVQRLWPPTLIGDTLPWFDHQARINRVLWEGGKPLRLIDDLDAVLTGTRLRTLPLWMLGSDAVKQRIAATGNDGTGTVEYLRGVQMLVSRDYSSAASYFGLAERRGLPGRSVRPLIAYALRRDGRMDLSRQVVATIQPDDADTRHFLDWMAAHCR